MNKKSALWTLLPIKSSKVRARGIFFSLIGACFIVGGFLTAGLVKKAENTEKSCCSCQNCNCTAESHCGCYGENGCCAKKGKP